MAQRPGIIPTILITGFLGAGKTTLLNRLITHYKNKRTVLLINEFGKIGIDGELLDEGNYQKIELNRGSLFCICVRSDFISEVEMIASEIQPELLVIEATGLADTSEMEKMLALPNLKDKIKLAACICLVDCQNFLKIKDNLKAPLSQIKSADLVILNKLDLVSPETVSSTVEAVKDISSKVEIIKTSYADFPLNIIDRIQHMEVETTGTLDEGRPDPVFSITLNKEGSFTKQGWNRFQSVIEKNIMRVKGFVVIEKEIFHVDATPQTWSLQRMDHGDNMNRLIIIGRNLKQQEIEALFDNMTQNLSEK